MTGYVSLADPLANGLDMDQEGTDDHKAPSVAVAKSPSRAGKTIVLSAGRALSSVATLVLAAILSRVFTKTDYATYKQTLLVFLVAMPLFGMGIPRALYFFLPNAGASSRRILIENLSLLAFSGATMAVFIWFGGNTLIAVWLNNAALTTTLLVAAPLALFRLPAESAPACLVARDRTKWAAVFSAVSGSLALLFVLAAVLVAATPTSAIVGTVFGAAFVCAFATRLMWLSCDGNVAIPEWSGVKAQLAYGIPLGLSSMLGQLSRNVDKAMVSGLTTPEEFANYINGAVELPLFSVLTGSMTAVLMVDYKKLLDAGNGAELLRLQHRAMIKSGTVILPVMFFLWCVAPEFMAVVFGPDYRVSAPVFRIYLLILPVRMLVFGSVLMAAGKTQVLAAITVVSLAVNTCMNYVAIKEFGVLGAAYATVFTVYCIAAFFRAIVASKILECSLANFIPWRDVARLMLASSVGVPVVMSFLRMTTGQVDFVRLLSAFLIYGAITLATTSYMKFVSLPMIIAYFSSKLRIR